MSSKSKEQTIKESNKFVITNNIKTPDLLNLISKSTFPTLKKQNFFTLMNNYDNKFVCNKYDIDMLYNNLNKMIISEKQNYLHKIMSENYMNNILLKYEFENIKFDKKYMELKEFDLIVNKLLNRYTHKIGGKNFLSKWIKNSTLYHKSRIDTIASESQHKLNIIIYENMINNNNCDEKLLKFLGRLYEIFSTISTNFNINITHYYRRRDNLKYIYFIFNKIT